jgi:histone H2A
MPKEVHEQFNFLLYIRKVLKQVHPDITITTEAINEMNLLIHSVAEGIINKSSHLAKTNKKKTISSREIQTAVRLCFPGDLSQYAVSAGTKALGDRTGLQFPVKRTEGLIRHHSSVERVGADAPVFLSAVLEYLTAELLQLAGHSTRDNRARRIAPRYLQLAIRSDEEMSKLFSRVTLSGGVMPYIPLVLLPNRRA